MRKALASAMFIRKDNIAGADMSRVPLRWGPAFVLNCGGQSVQGAAKTSKTATLWSKKRKFETMETIIDISTSRHSGTIAALLVLFFVSEPFSASFAGDNPYELAIAEKAPYQGRYVRLRTKYYMAKPDKKPEMALNLLNFVKDCPDETTAAYGMNVVINYEFKMKEWNKVIELCSYVFDHYPNMIGQRAQAEVFLARIVFQKKIDLEIRSKAFALFARHVKRHGSYLAFVRNYVNEAYSDPRKRYDTASKLALEAGRTCSSAAFWWDYLRQLPDTLKDTKKNVSECSRFMEFCGKNSLFYDRALQLKLRALAANGDSEAKKEYEAIVKKSRKLLKQAGSLLESALNSIKAKKYAEAEATVAKFADYPVSVIDKVAGKIVNSIPKLPTPAKLRIAAELAKLLPNSKNLGNLYIHINRDAGVRSPELINIYFNFLETVFSKEKKPDATTAGQRSYHLSHIPREWKSSPAPAIRLYGILIDYCLRAGVKDMAAELLFKKAKLEFDSDRTGCERDLRACAKVFPGSAAALKARWMLSVITGEYSIIQGPATRKEFFFTSALPNLSKKFVEKLPKQPLETARLADGVFSLTRADEKTNLLNASAIVAAYGAGETTVVADEDASTVWIPKTKPAVILAPLKKVSSLNAVTVRMSGKVHFHIDLLDSNGNTLRRLEREWPFQHYLSPQYAPNELVEMKFRPVADVAGLRLVLTDSVNSESGIAEMAAYESKFPATAKALLKTVSIPSGEDSMILRCGLIEPEKQVKYKPDMEDVRGYPIMRWANPWKSIRKAPVYIRTVGHNLGIDFTGTTAIMKLMRRGGLTWNVDFAEPHRVSKESADLGNEVNPTLKDAGRHMLSLRAWPLPAHNDVFGADNVVFKELLVTGKAKAAIIARFRKKGASVWGPWKTIPRSGKKVEATISVREYRGGDCQIAMFADTKNVLGEACPAVSNLNITFEKNNTPAKLADFTVPKERSFVNDNLTEVVKHTACRRVVVVYSKTGTKEEYEVAKAIAEKAGVYLAPDDVALNGYSYPGPILAIGTPARNRYCRQLIAQYGVYADPKFLNDQNGFTGEAFNAEGKVDFRYATAAAPAGVVKAARRILAELARYQAASKPFELFDASTIERIFPWELHPERDVTTPLKLEMGANDRRSIQLGVSFNQTVKEIKATCTELTNATGAKLAAPKVRFMQFYECVPWFGNLRIPDPLAEKPITPIPANTATGIWFTFKTAKTAPPGVYKGTVTITADGKSDSVPVEVRVLRFALPPINRIDTASYTSLPYWYHLGTKESERVFKNLCQNEVEHALSMITVKVFPKCVFTKTPDGKYSFKFTFTNLKWQLKIADEVYKNAGAPPPAFFAMPTLPPVFFLNQLPRSERKGIDVEYQYATQLTAFLKSMGCFERFYFKVGDEPRNMTDWAKLAKPFKRGGLKITTAHATRYKDMDKATGIMDAFCPNYQHNVFIPYLKERRSAGDKIWWYSCGVPMNRITGKTVDNLPLYWLTGKWNFDGVHSYGGLSVPESGVEGNDLPFSYDHGLAFRIMLLPDGAVIDTIRRELESEGIRDALLIFKIKDYIAKLAENGQKIKAAEFKKQLDEILESVVPYKYGYAQTAKEWESARAKLYAMAAKLAWKR